jgi:hypothetical protein
LPVWRIFQLWAPHVEPDSQVTRLIKYLDRNQERHHMTVSERAISSALGWPTPLACLYSLAMETGIGIRDYWHDDSGIAAIADDGLRADVLAMALEVAIAMTNRPGAICAPGGFAVITPHRVPVPAAGVGKFATLMARACGRATASAAFEYYVPGFPGDGHEPGAARRRLTAAGRLVLPRASLGTGLAGFYAAALPRS